MCGFWNMGHSDLDERSMLAFSQGEGFVHHVSTKMHGGRQLNVTCDAIKDMNHAMYLILLKRVALHLKISFRFRKQNNKNKLDMQSSLVSCLFFSSWPLFVLSLGKVPVLFTSQNGVFISPFYELLVNFRHNGINHCDQYWWPIGDSRSIEVKFSAKFKNIHLFALRWREYLFCYT